MEEQEPARVARNILVSDEVNHNAPVGPTLAVAAQAWAMLAVADAIDRLASAVEALQAR
jgi:hypothetical protein